jgi:hypothetical protein
MAAHEVGRASSERRRKVYVGLEAAEIAGVDDVH